MKDEPRSGRGKNRLVHYPPEACGKRSAARFREVGASLAKGSTLKNTVIAPPQSSESE
jgi:hypothetical protein